MKATNLKTKEEVVKCFEQLRLPGAKEKYLELESLPNSGEMTLTEQLGILLQHELDTRSAKRLERLVRESGLRKTAAFTSARLESLIDEKERGFSLNISPNSHRSTRMGSGESEDSAS